MTRRQRPASGPRRRALIDRSDAALRKTFELVAETGPARDDFDALFANASPDLAGALDGVLDAANMPLDKEPTRVATDLRAIRSLAASSRA
jgi:hypothetical protein